MNKLEKFLEGSYPPDSFDTVLQKFIKNRRKKCLSKHTVCHLFRSLHALGEWLGNPPLKDISKQELMEYTYELKTRYSPGTLRSVFGDIKQFFKWCKRKKYIKKNIAKRIKKPRQISATNRATPEENVLRLINHFAEEL